MRMFQSVSGQSTEQSTAYFCWRPTVSQLTLIWESPNTEDKYFHRHCRSFPFKLESNGLQIDHNRKFSERIFSTLAIFQATSKFFGSLGWSDDKNWLELSSNFFRICRFRSSILLSLQVFVPREATLKSSLTVAWFSWTNHNPLLRIASFCSGAPAARRAAKRSPIIIMHGKEKETHELIFSWLSWLAVLLVGAYARRRRRSCPTWRPYSKKETYSLSLPRTSLILDIPAIINWHLSKQAIRWPVPRDYIAGSSLQLIELTCFYEVDRWLSVGFPIGSRAHVQFTCW